MQFPGYIDSSKVESQEVTPLKAAGWLEKTKNNIGDIQSLVESINSEGWTFEEPIILTHDGIILDGKRRLAALVATDTTAQISVRYADTISSHANKQVEAWRTILNNADTPIGNYSHWLIHSVCFLFYFKLVHAKGAEEKAVADFNDEPYAPVISDEFINVLFHANDEVDSEYLDSFLIEEYTRALDAAGIDRAAPLERDLGFNPVRLTRILEWYDTYADQAAMTGLSLTRQIQSFDFNDQNYRQLGLEIINCLMAYKGLDGGKLGAYATPPAITEFMVSLAEPKAGEYIYDPCCGTGALLVKADEYIKRHQGASEGANLEGVEIDHVNCLVARCRFALKEIDDSDLHLGDAIEGTHLLMEERSQDKKCDLILAVPPMGATREQAVKMGAEKISDLELLFLHHTLKNLKPGGRAVICLRRSFSYRGGPAKKLRKLLLDNYRVEYIGELPKGAFSPHSGIESNIFLIHNREPSSQILIKVLPEKMFLDKDRLGLQRSKTRIEEIRGHASGLVNEGEWPRNPADYQSISLLKENEYDLSIQETEFGYLDHCLDELVRESSQGSGEIEVEIEFLALCATINLGVPNLNKHKSIPDEAKELIIEGQLSQEQMEIRSRQQTEGGTLIKVGDIKSSESLSRSKDKLHAYATEQFANKKLETGDILLSIGGTIGRTAFLRKQDFESHAQGLFAVSGIAVIRIISDAVLPEYVEAILSSSVYQAYLESMARGGTISRLSIKEIRRLRIPVPPLPIQQQVARMAYGEQTPSDPFEILQRITYGGEIRAISTFLKLFKGSELEAVTTTLNENNVNELGAGIEMISGIYHKYAKLEVNCLIESDEEPPEELDDAFNLLADSVKSTYQADKIHTYVLLGNAQKAFRQIAEAEDSPFKSISKKICDLIQKTVDAIFPESREDGGDFLGFRAHVDEIQDNHGNSDLLDISLTIDVFSETPLRRVQIKCGEESPFSPPSGEDYMNPGEEVYFDDVIDSSKELIVFWEAEHFNGKKISGQQTVELEYPKAKEETGRPITEDLNSSELPTSPWNAGEEIEDLDQLYGREKNIDAITRYFKGASTRGKNLIVFGNRRAGKSSILRTIKKEKLLNDHVMVYMELQNTDGTDACYLWNFMAKHIWEQLQEQGHPYDLKKWGFADALSIKKSDGLQYQNKMQKLFPAGIAFESFDQFVAEAVGLVHPKKILLVIDEYTVLNELIKNKELDSRFTQQLRSLYQKHRALNVVFAGVHLFRESGKLRTNEHFRSAKMHGVGSISKEAALSLIREPLKDWIRFTDDAANEICNLTDNFPYCIQKLCDHIYDFICNSGDRLIDQKLVLKVADENTDDQALSDIWEYWVETDVNRYILAVIHRLSKNNDGEPVSLSHLTGALASANVRIGADVNWESGKIRAKLEDLVDRNLLGKGNVAGEKAYGLRMEWLGIYIDNEAPSEQELQEASIGQFEEGE